MTASDRMTEERLAEIREQCANRYFLNSTVEELVTELDRSRAVEDSLRAEVERLREFADAVCHWREKRLALPAAFDSFERALRDAYDRLGTENTYRPCSHEIGRDAARAELAAANEKIRHLYELLDQATGDAVR